MRDPGLAPYPVSVRVVAGFAAALLILVAIGVDSYRSALGLAQNTRRVAHTHEVVSQLWSLSSDIVTIESRRRAFALTGDEQNVARSQASGVSAKENVQVLRRLTADNLRQQERLDRLERLIDRRLDAVEKSIDRLRRMAGEREAQAAVTAAAAEANDEIRGVIREMLDEEHGLLARRDGEADRSLRRMQWVIVLGSISAGLLVGAASLLFTRESLQRRRAESELRRREALYRSVLRQFPNGAVLIYDRDLRYLLAEGRGLEAVGLSKEELEGRTIHEALPPETVAAIEQSYRAALAGQTTSFEVPFRDRHFAVHVSPLSGDREGALGMVVSLDVTERRRAQEDVLRLNRELEQNVAEMVAMNKELEAFSYSVSHDLRAPIRHIGGFVELLQRRAAHALDDTAHRHLRTIALASKHMGQLIDDLLAFTRMARVEMFRSPVALGPLTREVIDGLQPQLEGRSVEWKVDGLPEVTGDRALLRIVLSNLLDNAAKFTRPRTQALIEIGRAEGAPGEVVLFVKDNGVGFDMQYADKLFGVFQRLHRSEEFEGTGIGLATVRRIVRRHGGRTWAESSVGGGATFFVALPAPAGARGQPARKREIS